MLPKLLIFLLSTSLSLTILYVLGIVWFGDRRNHMVRSFFVLGIITNYWIVFNGILAVTSERSFPVMLTLGMVFVCCLPFALFRFTLHYTRSSLTRSKGFMALAVMLPLLDVALMVTSPMHRLYFSDYAYPIPGKGPLFWLHTALGLSAVLLSVIFAVRYAFKAPRHRYLTFAAGVGTLASTAIHVLFALNPNMRYDLSSIGFLFTFLLYAFSAHKARIIRLRRMSVDQIFDSLDDVCITFDETGAILDRNAAATAAFQRFDIPEGTQTLEAFVGALYPWALRCSPEGLFIDIENRAERCEGEVRLALHGGQIKTYTVRWHAILHKGVPGGYVLSMSDTSAYHDMIDVINRKNRSLTELSEAATAASKAKSAFLANMSHEIRTPLNAIIGMAHIAKMSPEDPCKASASMDQVLRASRLLLELLNNILDMSKIESGKFSLSCDPFSPRAALDEVIDIFQSRCAEKVIALESDIDALPDWVEGDALRLKQVLINLLGNAVKFTGSGGHVGLMVGSAVQGDVLRMSVSVVDTGIGMTPEQISRLFTAFEQADRTTAARFGGTGIGLALSQHLLSLMGSAITVESKPGEGSCFTFTLELPLTAAGDSPRAEQTSDSLDLSGRRVLIVDDIDINRLIMAEFLEGTGAAVEEAEDGTRALALIEASPEGHYDLIFMDIQMPGLDGYAATRHIRKFARADTRTLPIVAMTANAYREDVNRALEAGMTAHLAKPLGPEAVLGLMAQLLPAG